MREGLGRNRMWRVRKQVRKLLAGYPPAAMCCGDKRLGIFLGRRCASSDLVIGQSSLVVAPKTKMLGFACAVCR